MLHRSPAAESVNLREFANEWSGFVALATQVAAEQTRCGAAAVQWVVERVPLGRDGNEHPLVSVAQEQGWAISLPNPRQVHQWAKGSGQRAQTAPSGPPQDALVLARFGAAQQPAPQRPLAVAVSELDSLLQR